MPCVCALRRESRPRWRACFVLRRRWWKRGNPFRHFALRNATSPEGGGLGRTGRFRPHRLLVRRSLPLSCKLSALAKASPFRERWHGEAVTERVASGRTLSVACGDSSPEGRALGRTGRSRPYSSTAGKSLPLSCKLFALAKASPLSGEVARRSRDGEGFFRTNPLSRLRRQLFPFLSPVGDIFPRPGEVFPLRESPWQNRQVSSSFVNGRRSQLVNHKLPASAKASPFRERWHGEAVTERVSSGTNPLSLAALDSSPEGRALGKEGRFRPHSLTAERIQLLSCKLFALAKASPFRERWHGGAVTERVVSGMNPLRLFVLDHLFPFPV